MKGIVGVIGVLLFLLATMCLGAYVMLVLIPIMPFVALPAVLFFRKHFYNCRVSKIKYLLPAAKSRLVIINDLFYIKKRSA